MRTVKLLIALISFSLMSTGCRYEHHGHEGNSSKTEKSNHSHKTDEKADEKHRH